MILKNLEIELNTYGKEKGKYTGRVDFQNEDSKIQLRLTPEHINKIFELCADALVQTAKDAANEMTVNIIEHKKALEKGDS